MQPSEDRYSRRHLVRLGVAITGLLVAGCSREAKAERIPMTVYRDPGCGCCEAWAKQAAQAGFDAKVINDTDMTAVKRKLGVPEELASCHTAMVAGYAVEGHVPFADVQQLLRERPAGVRGLAVPGMPAGSPGMETPDGTKQPYEVIAFGAGRPSVYRKYG